MLLVEVYRLFSCDAVLNFCLALASYKDTVSYMLFELFFSNNGEGAERVGFFLD